MLSQRRNREEEEEGLWFGCSGYNHSCGLGIQKQGTRKELGQIRVSPVQCIGIMKVMVAYINNGNSGILLSSVTDSDRRCQTAASSPTSPFLVLPIQKQVEKSDKQSS